MLEIMKPRGSCPMGMGPEKSSARGVVGIGILSLILAGCGPAISSTQVSSLSAQDRRANRDIGQKYYLPRAVMMAWVVVNPSRGARVVIGQAEYLPDNGASWIDTRELMLAPNSRCMRQPAYAPLGAFTLNHRSSGFHEDTIGIEVDNGLLKSVTADTKQKTTAALIGAAKSLGMLRLEAGVLEEDIEVFSARFDPADCRDLAMIEKRIRDAIDGPAISKITELVAASPKSALAKLKLLDRGPSNFSLALNGHVPFRSNRGQERIAYDCRIGICVPDPAPASFAIALGEGRHETAVIYIPNRSEPVPIPISRAAFADVKTTLTLNKGMLTKREVVAGSEFLSLFSLPGELLGANLTAASSFLKGEKGVIDDQVALEKAREAAKEKAEAGELTEGSPLIALPVPGLSVGGGSNAANAVGLQTPGGAAAAGAALAKPPKESAQGDGQTPASGENGGGKGNREEDAGGK